jgi:hypothetical protein
MLLLAETGVMAVPVVLVATLVKMDVRDQMVKLGLLVPVAMGVMAGQVPAVGAVQVARVGQEGQLRLVMAGEARADPEAPVAAALLVAAAVLEDMVVWAVPAGWPGKKGLVAMEVKAGMPVRAAMAVRAQQEVKVEREGMGI